MEEYTEYIITPDKADVVKFTKRIVDHFADYHFDEAVRMYMVLNKVLYGDEWTVTGKDHWTVYNLAKEKPDKFKHAFSSFLGLNKKNWREKKDVKETYFILYLSGNDLLCKIGESSFPQSSLDAMKRYRMEAVLVKTMPEKEMPEWKAHSKFWDYRKSGEVFFVRDKLKDFLKSDVNDLFAIPSREQVEQLANGGNLEDALRKEFPPYYVLYEGQIKNEECENGNSSIRQEVSADEQKAIPSDEGGHSEERLTRVDQDERRQID